MLLFSNVFDFDLSKYEVFLNGTSTHYDSTLGPNVKEENLRFTLVSDKSIISAVLTFMDGSLGYCGVHIKGEPSYSQTPSQDLLKQSNNILHRYQNYTAQNSFFGTSYISAMESAIDTASELNSTFVPSDSAKLNVTVIPQRSTNIETTTITYFYSENGLDAPTKSLALSYTDGVLTSIGDSWNLYTIGGINTISQDEALKIAWVAAQNFKLHFVSDNGSVFELNPDLTNVKTLVTFGFGARNYSVLYPSWSIQYYFEKPIYNDYGIQVCVWGDTKEVFNVHSLVMLGTPDSSVPSTPSSLSASESSRAPTPALINNSSITLVLVISTMIVLAIVLSVVVAQGARRQSKH